MIKNYYKILGLKPDSLTEEIKKAYRRLAMKYHPDRNRGDLESEARLKEINEAYHILGNEEKKRYYDLQYRYPFENTIFYEEGGHDDFITVLRKFSQRGFDTKRTGGCMGRGLGKGRCGRKMEKMNLY